MKYRITYTSNFNTQSTITLNEEIALEWIENRMAINREKFRNGEIELKDMTITIKATI